MPTVRLTDRALVSVSGEDAESLLQNVITTDLDKLDKGELKPGALLTPQGKILFDFLISRHGKQALVIDLRADMAEALVQRLALYRLRAKAEISLQDQADVVVDWEHDSSGPERDPLSTGAWLRDRRFLTLVVRRGYGSGAEPSDEVALWTHLRIENGVAESGADYALGDAFPHDVLLDQSGGVGFKKGCYVGQEVVSRMQHRGTARRRVLIFSGSDDLPASGTPVMADGREAGSLGSVVGDMGLAICRTDRIKEALDKADPILAGGVPVFPEIPGWATFRYPDKNEADGS